MNISDHINAQRAYFNSQITKPISFRKAALIQLKKAIEKLEKDFDILNKSKIYRGRGESKYNNIYLDVENK